VRSQSVASIAIFSGGRSRTIRCLNIANSI
jgi:hypothetical protein